MMDEKRNSNIVQNIILENRERLNISGVNDILNFDESAVLVDTSLGLIHIKGHNLKMNRLSIDNTELMVEGNISSIMYSENHAKTSFMQKLFK